MDDYMAGTASHQRPTPERFFNAINAYEQTGAKKTAVELEIFTAIAEGNTTAATGTIRSSIGHTLNDASVSLWLS
jgi:hypothetical protein